ncbi:MAG: glutamate ABC transporter substrate-binding protein [Sporichthyaceae bacterium]
MKLRRLTTAAAVLTLTLGLASCSDDEEVTASTPVDQPTATADADSTFPAGSTMARLAEAGAMTVGTKFDQPLFGLKGLDDEPAGFDVEIAKIIAAELGIDADDITWIETPSAVREERIVSGDADMVVATYTINATRGERIDFAGPYYVAGQTLMVADDDTEITGPDSLRETEAKVCSVTGSTPALNILEYVDEDQVTLFDVYSKCADALRTGQVDAVTTDNVILLGLVENSDGAFKLVGDTFTVEPYGIGIAEGDLAFCEFIHDTLRAAAQDGRYAKAWEDTAGQVEPETPELPELYQCGQIPAAATSATPTASAAATSSPTPTSDDEE